MNFYKLYKLFINFMNDKNFSLAYKFSYAFIFHVYFEKHMERYKNVRVSFQKNTSRRDIKWIDLDIECKTAINNLIPVTYVAKKIKRIEQEIIKSAMHSRFWEMIDRW